MHSTLKNVGFRMQLKLLKPTGKEVDSSKCCPTAKSELSKKPEPATFDLSSGLRCSVLVFVTNSTLLALKTLQSRPLTTSVLSDRQPQSPLLFLHYATSGHSGFLLVNKCF
jgi:hypothetical protein